MPEIIIRCVCVCTCMCVCVCVWMCAHVHFSGRSSAVFIAFSKETMTHKRLRTH